MDIDDTNLDQEDGVLTNDVRGVIRPALKDLKIAIVRRTAGLRQVRVCVHLLLIRVDRARRLSEKKTDSVPLQQYYKVHRDQNRELNTIYSPGGQRRTLDDNVQTRVQSTVWYIFYI